MRHVPIVLMITFERERARERERDGERGREGLKEGGGGKEGRENASMRRRQGTSDRERGRGVEWMSVWRIRLWLIVQ